MNFKEVISIESRILNYILLEKVLSKDDDLGWYLRKIFKK